jgi:hypothetical protein
MKGKERKEKDKKLLGRRKNEGEDKGKRVKEEEEEDGGE